METALELREIAIKSQNNINRIINNLEVDLKQKAKRGDFSHKIEVSHKNIAEAVIHHFSSFGYELDSYPETIESEDGYYRKYTITINW